MGRQPFPYPAMPRTLPQRWTVFGECFDSTCCSGTTTTTTSDCDCDGVGYEEYDTVQDMLLDTPIADGWRNAVCFNYLAGDGTITHWTRYDGSTLVPNGTDVRQASDGAILQRTYVRENV